MAKTTTKVSPVKKNHKNGVQLNILFTVEEVESLEREMARREKEHPGIRWTRGSFARHLILSSLTVPKRTKKAA
jgi:hypothetical protein